MADPTPAIITTSCGCFFQGRELVVSPSCAEHTDDLDDEQTEYTFDQLSDRAKERARDWYRRDYPDHDWWDSVYEDADKIASMLGITIATKPVKLMNGKTRHDPAIWFSGFYSQGDGACFEGGWSPEDDPMSILDQVLAHAPQDEELHTIAFAFAELSERHGPNCAENGESHFRITHSGRYSHEHSVDIEMISDGPEGSEDWNELQALTWSAVQKARGMDTWDEEVREALRDFMRWIYSQLEAEHDYLTSDDHIDEMLADYTFDEDGAPA